MSLLISRVFGDEVQVFSADDESSVHLGGDNGASQDTAANAAEMLVPSGLHKSLLQATL